MAVMLFSQQSSRLLLNGKNFLVLVSHLQEGEGGGRDEMNKKLGSFVQPFSLPCIICGVVRHRFFFLYY